MRATPSTEPPAGYGTTIVTVRLGYFSALTDADPSPKRTTLSAARTRKHFIGGSSSALALEGPRVASPVDQQILAGDETGMCRAQKREIGAELRGAAKASGRVGGRAFLPDLVERLATRLEHALDMPDLRIAIKNTRQQIVD